MTKGKPAPPYTFLSVGVTCNCGHPEFLKFDVAAPPYSRTLQCPCGQILEIRRPIVLDRGIFPALSKISSPATGEPLKGDPR